MSVARIASRYAKSLIDLSVEQNQLEEVYGDITYFMEVAKNRDFSLMLKSPIIKSDLKKNAFNALFENKLSKLTNSFFDIILRKNREKYMVDIGRTFLEQYKAYKQVSSVRLTTAKPLSEASVQKIKETLLSSSKTNKNIELETFINEDILGGFVIEWDDKLYDASVAHKVELLRKEFNKNEYIKNF